MKKAGAYDDRTVVDMAIKIKYSTLMKIFPLKFNCTCLRELINVIFPSFLNFRVKKKKKKKKTEKTKRHNA